MSLRHINICNQRYIIMKTRIAQLISSEGLTSSKFADTIGVQRSSISHILSGRNNPSLDFIQKILNSFTNVNLEWLISGTGEMYKEKVTGLFDMPTEEETVSTPFQPPRLKKEPLQEPLKDSKTSIEASFPPINPFIPGKQIEKVVVFYSDKTFKEYNPA